MHQLFLLFILVQSISGTLHVRVRHFVVHGAARIRSRPLQVLLSKSVLFINCHRLSHIFCPDLNRSSSWSIHRLSIQRKQRADIGREQCEAFLLRIVCGHRWFALCFSFFHTLPCRRMPKPSTIRWLPDRQDDLMFYVMS
ncbi:hypothetical protein HELRODRAFT_192628 [Helobdella robusta]|uniref:Secreted protein n=1 Tax=Helobdella robusta TaxID=6412 RepID=T1FU50_HELRO|nr:hypothetical protein HELRODRAFT_192628 [Helobdella robusta]ESO00204.1 hypothetical protein HELRODRAFT_192628 [Helobdella robusta]